MWSEDPNLLTPFLFSSLRPQSAQASSCAAALLTRSAAAHGRKVQRRRHGQLDWPPLPHAGGLAGRPRTARARARGRCSQREVRARHCGSGRPPRRLHTRELRARVGRLERQRRLGPRVPPDGRWPRAGLRVPHAPVALVPPPDLMCGPERWYSCAVSSVAPPLLMRHRGPSRRRRVRSSRARLRRGGPAVVLSGHTHGHTQVSAPSILGLGFIMRFGDFLNAI